MEKKPDWRHGRERLERGIRDEYKDARRVGGNNLTDDQIAKIAREKANRAMQRAVNEHERR